MHDSRYCVARVTDHPVFDYYPAASASLNQPDRTGVLGSHDACVWL